MGEVCRCGCGTALEPPKLQWHSLAHRQRFIRRERRRVLQAVIPPSLEPVCRCGAVAGSHHYLLDGEEWEVETWGTLEVALAPHHLAIVRGDFPPRRGSMPSAERFEAFDRLALINAAIGRYDDAKRCAELAAGSHRC